MKGFGANDSEHKLPKEVRYERRDYKDIGFTAIAEPMGQDDIYAVRFEIYTIVSTDINGTVFWQRRGACSSLNPVNRLDEAELYLHGHVKWDGCSNWYFDEQDRVMLHCCGLNDIENIGKVMKRCWKWAGEFMTHWEGD